MSCSSVNVAVVVMVVMASGVVGARAAGNVDVRVASRNYGDGRVAEGMGMMMRAAWGNGSGVHSGDRSRVGGSRASSSCYTCSASSCSTVKSCTMSDAVCMSGFEVATGVQIEGCASRALCEQYARAYACDVKNTEVYTGYCCCNSKLCNSDINTCKAEILSKCRNGAVTVAGRLGGLTAMLALLLPLLLA